MIITFSEQQLISKETACGKEEESGLAAMINWSRWTCWTLALMSAVSFCRIEASLFLLFSLLCTYFFTRQWASFPDWWNLLDKADLSKKARPLAFVSCFLYYCSRHSFLMYWIMTKCFPLFLRGEDFLIQHCLILARKIASKIKV